jgi:hypothetical protein
MYSTFTKENAAFACTVPRNNVLYIHELKDLLLLHVCTELQEFCTLHELKDMINLHVLQVYIFNINCLGFIYFYTSAVSQRQAHNTIPYQVATHLGIGNVCVSWGEARFRRYHSATSSPQYLRELKGAAACTVLQKLGTLHEVKGLLLLHVCDLL